jgi:serine/threonine protein kinase
MTLALGTKLGPYELLAPIGAGGMGEVYKARDTRLGRIVAIKKVKEQHSERFKQEARTIAALNHPYIWDYASYCTSLDITSATF